MKNVILGWILFLCAQVPFVGTASENLLPVVEYRDVFANPLLMNEFVEGKCIMEIPQGAQIAFQVTLSGDCFAIHGGNKSIWIKALKSIYVLQQIDREYPEEREPLFSSDLETWKTQGQFFIGSLTSGATFVNGFPVVQSNIVINQAPEPCDCGDDCDCEECLASHDLM